MTYKNAECAQQIIILNNCMGYSPVDFSTGAKASKKTILGKKAAALPRQWLTNAAMGKVFDLVEELVLSAEELLGAIAERLPELVASDQDSDQGDTQEQSDGQDSSEEDVGASQTV